jgi:hypothetical protein
MLRSIHFLIRVKKLQHLLLMFLELFANSSGAWFFFSVEFCHLVKTISLNQEDDPSLLTVKRANNTLRT